MATIFPTARGSVIEVDTCKGVVPFKIRLDGWSTNGSAFGQTALVTQAAVSQKGNYQFLHTLNDFIYVYVFGDRIGSLVVSGVALAEKCEGGGGSGMENAISFYQGNRLAVKGSPVKVSFGQKPFQGFLTDINVQVTKPTSSLGQYTFNFSTFTPGS